MKFVSRVAWLAVAGALFFRISAVWGEAVEFDPLLRQAAVELASDYLDDQVSRTYGTEDVKKLYGKGAVTIDLLRGYNIEGTGRDAVGHPTVFLHLRMGSWNVGFFHRRFTLVLGYFPESRAQGDKYLGLRISEVREFREQPAPPVPRSN